MSSNNRSDYPLISVDGGKTWHNIKDATFKLSSGAMCSGHVIEYSVRNYYGGSHATGDMRVGLFDFHYGPLEPTEEQPLPTRSVTV